MWLTVKEIQENFKISRATVLRRAKKQAWNKKTEIRFVNSNGTKTLLFDINESEILSTVSNFEKTFKNNREKQSISTVSNSKAECQQSISTVSKQDNCPVNKEITLKSSEKQRITTTKPEHQNTKNEIEQILQENENSLVESKCNIFDTASTDDKEIAFAWENILKRYEQEVKIGKANKLSITGFVDKEFIKRCESNTLLEKETAVIGNFSIKTLRRHLKKYKDAGRHVSALIPKRKGHSGRKMETDPIVLQFIRKYGAHPNRIDIAQLHEEAVRLFGDKVPSYSTIYKYYKNFVENDHVLKAFTHGKEYKRNKTKLHLVRKNDALPGMVSISDGYKMNILVRSPFFNHFDKNSRSIIRPWVVMWFDAATEMVTGYSCSSEESFATVVSSFRDSIEKCGVPESVMFDNGSAYKNVLTAPHWYANRKGKSLTKAKIKAMTLINRGYPGFFENIGVKKVTFVTPGNPEAKKIEPSFRYIFSLFEKSNYIYVAEKIENRPENLRVTNMKLLSTEGDKIPTWEVFLATLDQHISYYNSKKKKSLENQAPKQYYDSFGPYHIPSIEELNTKLVAIKHLKVTQNGVNVMGIPYYHPLFKLHLGKKVEVRYDVRNLRTIRIASLRGELWAKPADAMLPGSYTDQEMTENAIRFRNNMEKKGKLAYTKAINRGADTRKLTYTEQNEIMDEIEMDDLLRLQDKSQKKLKKHAGDIVDEYITSLYDGKTLVNPLEKKPEEEEIPEETILLKPVETIEKSDEEKIDFNDLGL